MRSTAIAAAIAASTAFVGAPASTHGQQAWLTTLEAESDPGLNLGRVTGLAVDSQRRVYVADAVWDGIAMLGADLTLEREVGRRGEGPGEFRWLATIDILAGDSLYVFDGGLGRVTVFEPSAHAVAYTYTVTLPGLNSPRGLWRIPRQGGYVGVRSPPVTTTQTERDDQRRSDIVFSLRSDGEMESDSILAVPSAEPLIVRSAGSVMVGAHPFGSEPFLSLLGDDLLVYADSRIPSVSVLDLDGTVHRSFAVPATEVPVDAAELRARIDSEEMEPFARALEQGAPYMWPALTGLIVDDERRIWVGARSESTGDQREWTAFTQEGRPEGSVLLPAGFDLHAVGGGRLFGVVTDEFGVPTIRVYRLEGE